MKNSKNEDMCFKKKSYTSHIEAKCVADRCNERRNVSLRVYQCPVCKWFHLTKELDSTKIIK